MSSAQHDKAVVDLLNAITKLLNLAYTYLDKRLREDEVKAQEKARRTS